MNVAVIGTGYVGLVAGTCFAEQGNQAVCIDIDEQKISAMRRGIMQIHEPGLEEYFQRNIAEKRLTFTANLAEGIKNADVIFLALPTPESEDGSADLSYVLDVAGKIGPLLNSYVVVVDKSTVPIGTAKKVQAQLLKGAAGDLFDVVSNPEFLREGSAVNDFMNPDRVIIGTTSSKAEKRMRSLYEPFVKSGSPILCMSEESAEMTKYVANAMLALRISFMNEVANLCELVGADVENVRAGVGTDFRIGHHFLFPGPGYGGSCFPKDTAALLHIADQNGYSFETLSSAIRANNLQKLVLPQKVKRYYSNLKGKKLALWGLSFKANTDDIRESPAIIIAQELLDSGAAVVAFDPVAIPKTKEFAKRSKILDGLEYANNPLEALTNTDGLVIATEWSEFHTPDFVAMKKTMKTPAIFDGRNLYDNDTLMELKKLGFHYESIGRPRTAS